MDISLNLLDISLKQPTLKSSTLENLKEDIRQGKEPEVLSLKYGTTVKYVKKVTSDMRRKGEELIDRRSNQWDLIQFRTNI